MYLLFSVTYCQGKLKINICREHVEVKSLRQKARSHVHQYSTFLEIHFYVFECFACMYVCMYVCAPCIYSWYIQRSEEGIGFPGAGVTDG